MFWSSALAIGPCQFITCRSTMGSSYRSPMYRLEGGGKAEEALICAPHERECDEYRKQSGKLMLSDEGVVYPKSWMDSLGFRS